VLDFSLTLGEKLPVVDRITHKVTSLLCHMGVENKATGDSKLDGSPECST